MASAELRKKTHIRAGHRGSATKMIARGEELLTASDLDIPKSLQLKVSLKEKVDVLKELDREILDLVEPDNMADEIEAADEFNGKIYSITVRIERALASTERSTLAAPASTATTAPSTHTPSTNKPKLPRITLQPFTGELTSWMSFWDSFKAAVHDNDALSEIDKFNYLRGLLQRTALEAISGLSLTAANYQEAVKILEKRFGNKSQIVAKHMDNLIHIKPVTSSHDLKGLRHLYDLVESNVRSLKSLGIEQSSYGGLLASVLINQIPQELQLIISRKVKDDDWNLDVILASLEDELQARERTSATAVLTVRKNTGNKDPPTTAAFLTGGLDKVSCSYCRGEHPSNTCGVVTHPSARKQVLQKFGRCFVCLRRGHVARECGSHKKCAKCGGRHHISICFKEAESPGTRKATSGTVPPKSTPNKQDNSTLHPPTPTQPSMQSTDSRSNLNIQAPTFHSQNQLHTSSLWVNSSQAILLQTAQALVFNPTDSMQSRRVRFVFDSGSQRSYIAEHITQELSLIPEGSQSMSILTFGSVGEQSHTCNRVRLGVALRNGRSREILLYTVPVICRPIACQPVSFCQHRYDHLKGIELADPTDGRTSLEVDVLIGSDLYWSLTSGEVRKGRVGPVAIKTSLGWVLSGPSTSVCQPPTSTSLITHTLQIVSHDSDEQHLNEHLKAFWELESFGVSPQSDHSPSVYQQFEESVAFVDGRYEVQLPWKTTHAPLNDHYQLCLKRLQGLVRRLQQEPEVLREYDATIKEQIKHGIVEVVQELDGDVYNQVHYLPHHAVVRRDKRTTRVRIVYDASAHADGPSLNECLHSGPKFDQKLLDILLRFRSHKIAISADIEKAFLMIAVRPTDRDVLRFLWYDDVFSAQRNVIPLRFTRVVFGVTCSPFLLNATIHHHLNLYRDKLPDLVNKLNKSVYVDDVITGTNDEESALHLFKESKEVLKEGGFNLRKFCSNSTMLQMIVDVQEQSTDPTSSVPTESSYSHASSTLRCNQVTVLGERKVLGVRWNLATDTLVIGLEEVALAASQVVPTKRSVVSLVGKIYDPFGLLSPVVVQFKIFIQKLYQSKLKWDEKLTDEVLKQWNSLASKLSDATTVTVPRCYFDGLDGQPISYSLCGFSDASLKAYAAVIYLLLETPLDRHVRIVASRTRVAPLKTYTIPRLELLAALLLARLMDNVSRALDEELPLTKPHCFSDSTVTVYWIRGTERVWKPFVQNRVSEIRALTPPQLWRHCAGKDNPADSPSRGLTPLELQSWISGPDWLKTADLDDHMEIEMPEECTHEMTPIKQEHGLLTTDNPGSIGQLIEVRDFSSYDHLLSVTSKVLKFCRIVLRSHHADTTGSTAANSEDLEKAEVLWIVESQCLLTEHKNFSQWHKQLGLFKDQKGIWRCGGRIQHAELSYSAKHPVLIAKEHPLATLLVRRAHMRVFHGGVKATLTELRSQFWIIQGRRFVRQIVRQCIICRRFEARPCRAPNPPPLPPFRVDEAPPFSYTGVDYAGPLFVKREGNLSNKVWICLFTCTVTRGVHLDVVRELSAPAFIQCFKRFTARRGIPSKMISDNGKSFQAAAKILRAIANHSDVQRHLSRFKIQWVFNLPRAPWWGGIFERLIRSTKRCLRKTIGRASLRYDELCTVVVEVEAVLNSRPLTYVSTEDDEEPLTPSHLLTGRRILSLPDHLCHDGEEDPNTGPKILTRRMRYMNKVVDQFWTRWRREYLLELRECHRQQQGSNHPTKVSVGDLVIVHSTEQPRAFWKLGLIKKLLTGSDGETRGAVIKVANRGKQSTTLYRPIQKLYTLEVEQPSRGLTSSNQATKTTAVCTPSEASVQPLQDSDDKDITSDNKTLESVPHSRPTRRTAQVARDRIMAQSLEN